MRIIAGDLRGQRIAAPKGTKTRPTSDFVRETTFNLIGPVDGASVIDVFAGSGALGIEALSRGAERATFVESDRDACRVINANLDKLHLDARVYCQDALRALAADTGTYDLVLCDPPYDYGNLDRLGPLLARVLAPEGLLVYQSDARTEPEIEGLSIRTSRKYGSSRLTLFDRE